MNATYILYQSIRDAEGEQIDADRWHCDDLHDAIRDLSATRTSHVGGVEYQGARYQEWNSTLLLTVQNASEYRTGESEERTLAVCGITRASARRLARLLRCEWSAY